MSKSSMLLSRVWCRTCN